MDYHEASNFLSDLRRYPPRTGIDATRGILEHLGAPGSELDVVQIGGSNGKGSTARMAESVLREAGYDVGLYTSPHLDDPRERVRINGRPVTKAAVADYVETIRPYVHERTPRGDPPTFFETLTALAVWAFAREGVDVAVLEVGIGGEHDATSALDPDAAAVTNVTLEHADLLGDTIAEIARDKAAIAPADRRLVTAADGEAFEAIAAVADRPIRVGGADADVSVASEGRAGVEQRLTVEGDGWDVGTSLPLLGSHQCRNAGVAAALCRQFGGVDAADIERGLRNAHWPGRFEVMAEDPLVVVDGAHNPGACVGVAETLSTFEYDELHLVFGAMADKDVSGMVGSLPPADVAYACRPDLDRAEPSASVAAVLEADGRAGRIDPCGSVAAALSSAIANADPGDAVVACGSLYLVAEARRRWTRQTVTAADTAAVSDALRRANVDDREVRRVRDDGAHDLVVTRVRPRQAARIESAFGPIGGTCATSAVDAQSHELVDAALMGTHAEFRALVDALRDRSVDLAAVADDLAAALDLEPEPDAAPEGGTSAAPASPDYPWTDGTAIMGVLNVTPDSFYDGGRYDALSDAVDRAEALVDAGADIVDVGGESTRPNADPVPIDEELERVVPVVEALADTDAAVSVDTRKAPIARAALDAGADILNDVSGLEDPEMRLVAAEYDVPVVVMHSIHTPVDPDADIAYDDVVGDTIAALEERVLLAEKAGLDRSQVIVDPGLGFGKTAAESFELLGRLSEFRSLGCPVLVGHSRKSMFGLVGHEDADDRLAATVAATALAAERGADIVRVHDVAENLAAVRTAAAAEDPTRFDG